MRSATIKSLMTAACLVFGNELLHPVCVAHEYSHLLSDHSPVSCVAFSPNGRFIAIAGSELFFWDTRQKKKAPCPKLSPFWVAFSPKGDMLATNQPLAFWQLAGFKKLAVPFEASLGPILFSSDGGQILTGACGNKGQGSADMTVWDVKKKAKKSVFTFEKTNITCFAFSPNGDSVAFGDSAGVIYLANVNSGKMLVKFHGHDKQVNSLQFLQDGLALVSTGSDCCLKVWNTKEQTLRKILFGNEYLCSALAVAPDGKVFATGTLEKVHQIMLFEVQSLKSRGRFAAEMDQVNCLSFSPDSGRLVAGGGPLFVNRGGKVNMWKFSTSLTGAKETDWGELLSRIGSDDAKIAYDAMLAVEASADECLPKIKEYIERFAAKPVPKLETARLTRCIEVLEHIGTATAKKILLEVIGFNSESWLVQEATKSLKRLENLEQLVSQQ